jgi:catechol 2,3-dioxygenase-like lactoylglutathione lyase family enzyme
MLLSSLRCGGGTGPWELLGLDLSGDTVSLGDVDLVISGGSPGLHDWSFTAATGSRSHDLPDEVTVDGIPTGVTRGETVPPPARDGRIGHHRVFGVDHVVVMTDDMNRTCAAIEAVLGLEMRRERDLGGGARQCFYKPDNSVLEVVTNPRDAHGGARLWGFVLSVDDLHGVCADLGPDAVSAPKPATQPGRFISTVRPAVGLGVQVALMSPHVPAT